MGADHAASGLRFLDFLSPWDKPRFVLDAEDRMTALRKPPKPPGWTAAKGICRFCAGEIWEDNGSRLVLKTAKRWHAWPEHPCLHLWAIASDPFYARVEVFRRDRGICQSCGRDCKPPAPLADPTETWDEVLRDIAENAPGAEVSTLPGTGPWELDHIHPLWLVDRTAPDALKFWLLGNMQTLCPACHLEKTVREASDRAKVKRITESGGLMMKRKNAREKRTARKVLPF